MIHEIFISNNPFLIKPSSLVTIKLKLYIVNNNRHKCKRGYKICNIQYWYLLLMYITNKLGVKSFPYSSENIMTEEKIMIITLINVASVILHIKPKQYGDK